MKDIFVLSLRALARGRRLLVVALLLLVPALLTLAYRLSNAGGISAQPFTHFLLPFALRLFDTLVMPILLPLTALIFGATALGGEVEDRTLVYLSLRPVARLSLVLAKWLAASLVTVVMVEAALALMYGVAAWGYAGSGAALGAILEAGAAGGLAYCSLFLLVGLVVPRRALLVGFIYVLVWEGAAAGISPALATMSVRRYVLGLLHAGLSTVSVPHLTWENLGTSTSTLVLAGIVLGGMALTTLRLKRMEQP